jgi:hypothetical protein
MLCGRSKHKSHAQNQKSDYLDQIQANEVSVGSRRKSSGRLRNSSAGLHPSSIIIVISVNCLLQLNYISWSTRCSIVLWTARSSVSCFDSCSDILLVNHLERRHQ